MIISGNEVEKIFWGKQQPNNYANEQDCAVLDSDLDWMWNDISCKVVYRQKEYRKNRQQQDRKVRQQQDRKDSQKQLYNKS